MSQTNLTEALDIELLVSKEVGPAAGVPKIRRRLKAYMLLLVASLVGFMGCAFATMYSDLSATKMQELDLARNASNLENIISLAFYPALLFMAVSIAVAVQLIYREYRSVYNPENYGRSRKRKPA